MPPVSSKKPKDGADRYVQKRDHPRIREVVEQLLKDSDDQDILHPAKLSQLTIKIAGEMAMFHKWYKIIIESPEPASVRLFRSLYDHIYSTWVYQANKPSSAATNNEQSSYSQEADPTYEEPESSQTAEPEKMTKHVSFQEANSEAQQSRVTRSAFNQSSTLNQISVTPFSNPTPGGDNEPRQKNVSQLTYDQPKVA